MKKIVLSSLLASIIGFSAYASDGGLYYTESNNYTNRESYRYETVSYTDNQYVAPRKVIYAKPRPKCASAAQPVHVKTHTEVINHYQVYQPVTVYKPAGTYSTREIVKTPSCGGCRY